MRSTLVLALALGACGTPSGTFDLFNGADPADPVTPEQEVVVEGEAPEATSSYAHRTRSGEMVADADGDRFYVVDPDNGALHTFIQETGQVFTLGLGGEPTRIVRADDTLFVTLRGSGEVVRLNTSDEEGPVESARVRVGAEPFDVVVSGHDRTILVSLSMEDAVVSLDADSLAVTHRWDVPGEPRWMAAAQGDASVYVASAREPLVTTLRADEPTLAPRSASLPTVERFTSDLCHDRTFEKRITGDLVLGPDDDTLYISSFYVDTFLVEPTRASLAGGDTWDTWDTGTWWDIPWGPNDGCDEVDDLPAPSPDADPNTVPYYAPPEPPETAAKAGRFNPTIVKMPVTSPGDATAFAIGTTLRPSEGDLVAARGYPGSLLLDDHGDGSIDLWVTMPTMDSVIRLAVGSMSTGEPTGNFAAWTRESMEIDARGPSSMLIANHEEGRRFAVWNHLERRLDISVLGLGDVVGPAAARRTMDAPLSYLPADVAEGRKLFYSSTDSRVVTPSSGGACSNCHADGRTDGFTWRFEDFPRQTPSLAGRVSDTVPVTWTGTVDTVLEEVHATTTNRMGGTGLSAEDASKVAAYVDWTRRVVVPAGDPALVEHGRALFEGEAGCIACHSGPAHTDGRKHSISGLGNRDTPSLRGIGATAPYYHDGRAATLRDVLESARNGSMGNTSMLTDEDLDAMVAYLRSL